MTERTLNPYSSSSAVGIQESGHADNRVGFEKRHRRRRIVHVDLARLDLCGEIERHGLGIHLESQAQRPRRAEARTDTAQFLSHDGLMQLELVAPERFVAEGIGSEDLATFI